MTTKIVDLKENDQINGVYLVSSIQVRSKAKPPYEEYLNITLQDDTGAISGNVWPNMLERLSGEKDIEALKNAKALSVQCEINEWNGKSMLNFIQVPTPVALSEVPELKEMIPHSFLDLQQAVNELKAYVQSIENVKLQQVACDLLWFDWEAFKSVPAGISMHHAYVGGLLTHSLGVLKASLKMYELYPNPDEINRDLLIVGAIGHDIGKITEYEIDEFGLTNKFSIDGNLLGHPYMGAIYIKELCKDHDVDEETSKQLQHMILAHHGKLEHGAAVTPKTLEAQILSLGDLVDCKLEQFRHQFEHQEKGTMSDTRVFSLENSFLYRKP